MADIEALGEEADHQLVPLGRAAVQHAQMVVLGHRQPAESGRGT
ncbi:hypothetical protein [Pseudonocardia sp. H11422]|nr:hypothetical protein [Pseudonocardia sp. H11422]